MTKPDISIVLVSYNTKDFTEKCLESLSKDKLKKQIIVSDNGSTDGSIELIRKKYPSVEIIENKDNIGFSAANNKAKKFIKSDYVLFLNTDTVVFSNSINFPLQFIKANKNVGAVTCRVLLKDGKDDMDTIRSFPTPMVALKHFLGMNSNYRYPKLDRSKTHDVDVIQGAYFMTSKEVLDKVGWFDEDYFLDGEDIDLSYRVKTAGFRLVYLPSSKITHFKKVSKKNDRKKTLKSVVAGVNAMELFYSKHLKHKYPLIMYLAVKFAINILKFLRIVKFYIFK